MELMNLNSAQTMTSREIAELVESRHDKVKQSIERLVTGGVISLPPMGGASFKDSLGRTQHTTEYRLGKRDSIIVVAQLCPEFTARLVDRWHELEKSNSIKIPQTMSEALFLGYEQAKKIEAQALKLEQQAPAVAYVENFVKCEGLIGIREAAKSLGLHQNAFVNLMIAAGVMYRENGHLQSYQPNIDAGRFVVKAVTDVAGKARSSTMFTAKGLRWVAQKLQLDRLFND